MQTLAPSGANISDVGTSEHSPSPSPIIFANGIMNEQQNQTNQKVDRPTNSNLESKSDELESLDIPNEQDVSSHDDSLHEMVQSILNDSDNDEVLNNLNGLGYNNIQFPQHETDKNEDDDDEEDDAPPVYRHPTVHNPSSRKQSKDSKPNNNTQSLNDNVIPSNRKYVHEWRTIIFIRHGKSKWNAAESNTLGKIVAAGTGLWEYYKHKKKRQNNIKAASKIKAASNSKDPNGKNKENITQQNIDKDNNIGGDNIDIMDAPLSREGILESLNLCSFLRQYNQTKELNEKTELLRSTRENVNDMIPILQSIQLKLDKDNENNEGNNTNTNTNNNMETKKEILFNLQQCLHKLDEYERNTLILQHPPPDDDNLRLPQPVLVTTNSIPLKPAQPKELVSINEHTIIASIDSANNNNNDDVILNGSLINLSPMGSNTSLHLSPTVSIDTPLPIPNTTTNDIEVELKDNNDNDHKTNKKLPKRYMQAISEPNTPLTAKYIINVLNGNETKCAIIVSNLRRAMSTACICLYDRLQRRPYEKIQILGCLQEIGLNSDTRPLLFKKTSKPILSKHEKLSPLLKGHQMTELYSTRLSTKYYKGDASDKTSSQRLQEFALWLFAQKKYLHILAVGHSHWFQSFFKAYLPDIDEDQLPAKVRTSKIRNCGVVAFRIQKKYVPSKSKRHGRHISFEIAPNSITTLLANPFCEPYTNHDLIQKQKEFVNNTKIQPRLTRDPSNTFISDDSEENNGIDDNQTNNNNNNNNNNTNYLIQSESVMATSITPGILASVHTASHHNGNTNNNINDKDNNLNQNRTKRPPPHSLPPPIPHNQNENAYDDEHINDENNNNYDDEKQKNDKNIVKEKSTFSISISKPKWMSNTMKKWRGNPDKDNDEKKEKEKKEKELDWEIKTKDAFDVIDGNNNKTSTNENDTQKLT